MNIWREYQDQGLQVMGVGTQDEADNVWGFAKQLGLTFPVVHDADSAVYTT